MNKIINIVLVILILSLSVRNLSADILVLNSGKKIEGTYIRQDRKFVFFSPYNQAPIKLEFKEIEKIILDDGDMLLYDYYKNKLVRYKQTDKERELLFKSGTKFVYVTTYPNLPLLICTIGGAILAYKNFDDANKKRDLQGMIIDDELEKEITYHRTVGYISLGVAIVTFIYAIKPRHVKYPIAVLHNEKSTLICFSFNF